MNIPDWFTPQNGPFAVSILPHTVGAGGVLSAGSPVALTAYISTGGGVQTQNVVNTSNIRPLNSKVANAVATEYDSTVTLEEILEASTASRLGTALYGSAEVFKVTITFGPNDMIFWGRKGTNGPTFNHDGESVFRAEFRQVDIGSAPVTYAAT